MLRSLRVAQQQMKRHTELSTRACDELDVSVRHIDVEGFLQDRCGLAAKTGLPIGATKRAKDAGAFEPWLFLLEQRCKDLDGLGGSALGGKLMRACDCHGPFTSLFFELAVFH